MGEDILTALKRIRESHDPDRVRLNNLIDALIDSLPPSAVEASAPTESEQTDAPASEPVEGVGGSDGDDAGGNADASEGQE